MTKIKTSSHLLLQKSWLDNGVQIFSLQFNFLRPSIYDLKTDESDPSFLSVSQKATHHQTYTKFIQHTKPKNYIFVNYKYTSPFTMTNIYTLDHSSKTGYLRNYDPKKQYYCLLPYNNTSRPLILPQEYLIHFDDFLLPRNVPTQIVKPLTVFKHLVRSMRKIEHIIQLSTNKHTHITNFYLLQPEPFRLWYKLNKNQNTK